MAKVITKSCHSPSRAVGPARGRAKRRQGCMRAGLLSNETVMVRSAEVVIMAEGTTAQTVRVRSGEGSAVSKNPGTHVRTTSGLGRPPRHHGA